MQGDKMIPTDLFEFAYVPDWYGQLDELAEMILPESWRFKKPTSETKNSDTPILERYINLIFRKQSIDHNTESDLDKATRFFHIENEYACFHTGLYNHRYKAIYGCFERNKKQDTTFKWYFHGFFDEISPRMKYIGTLPDIDVDRFHYVGNSSLSGSYAMLLSTESERKVYEVAKNMTYLELSAVPSYMDEFVAACFLPHTDITLFPSVENEKH